MNAPVRSMKHIQELIQQKLQASPEKENLFVIDETLEDGFVQIPNKILRRKDISLQAKTIFAQLLSYAWNSAHCFPGQERMALDLGVTARTVRKYLQELKNAEVVTWKQRGTNKTNVYFILPHRSRLEGKGRSGPDRKGRSY